MGGGQDLVLLQQHGVGGRAERDEGVGARDPGDRPSNPASTRAVTTPSETPPLRRVSSTTSTRRTPCAAHSRPSTGSGASQREVQHRAAEPLGAQACAATRSAMYTPLPKVTISRSRPPP